MLMIHFIEAIIQGQGEVYMTVVGSAVMYGAETRAVKKAQEMKLEVPRTCNEKRRVICG